MARKGDFKVKPGQQFGRLTVLDEAPKRVRNRMTLVPCRCSCGEQKWVRSAHLTQGATRSCGCLLTDLKGRKRADNTKARGESGTTKLWKTYVKSARLRGVEWALNSSEFEVLLGGDCYYCGVPPRQLAYSNSPTEWGARYYNGIDRVDNSLGYTPQNAVSCCETCNKAKRHLSLSEFMTWVHRLAAHQSSISLPEKPDPSNARSS